MTALKLDGMEDTARKGIEFNELVNVCHPVLIAPGALLALVRIARAAAAAIAAREAWLRTGDHDDILGPLNAMRNADDALVDALTEVGLLE